METMTVCLIGDDREREYPVTWHGKADFPRWDREAPGGLVGECEAALISTSEGKEALVANHPDYGWCSVGAEFARDFEPAVEQDRLNRAS